MKRRNFIKLTSSASAIGLLPHQVTSAFNIAKNFLNCDITNRKIILINLAGGNDGLNTLIPLDNYSLYATLRPTLKIPETGPDSYINLDTSLNANQQLGLHPALVGFKSLYDQGLLRILQSVGYPSQNKSHFASEDIYMTGNDGNSWNNGSSSGFIGRFMESFYADLFQSTFPVGVEIGSKSGSLGFHGEEEHGLAVNIQGQDPSGFYSILSTLGGLPPEYIPDSDYGDELQYIIQTDQLSNIYSQAIENAFNNGSNSATYEDTDISDQLKTVARLISGGLESKVYMVRLGGFDTHFSQIQSANGVIGKHNELLSELNDAVTSFMNDINAQSLEEDIVGLTFSEFGRKAAENGNLGTDHGEIAPMFVFGEPVNGGVSGTNVDLTEATSSNNYQITTYQYDYRQTIGTLFQDFLGADNLAIDATFFNHTSMESFADPNNKITELVKPGYSVASNCYTNTLSDSSQSKKYFRITPNPFKNFIYIKGNNYSGEIEYKIYDLNSRLVLKGNAMIDEPIMINELMNGIYLITLKFNNNSESHRIIKS